ncbi:MAG: MBL fold metallo-hydrolase [Nocardioides sp.]|uniref:MBL fold metallo-hydrolase n=1 Tax=Nocardioides sp. TaxID=35761 RepID=UPI0039E486EC
MKVHHLDCGTMAPPLTPRIPAHCLLVEGADGLVLVDTGFGLLDCADPAGRLGPSRFLLRPALSASQTAYRQIERLRLDPHDVRDIVITHADGDHTGGLADFPWARVHTTAAEARVAVAPETALERARYRSPQVAHGPRWETHEPTGEPWRGFEAVQEILDGILLIGFPGHTRGHAMVAVDASDGGRDRWVLHAGDAFYSRAQLTGGRTSPNLLLTERAFAHDWRRVQANHARLAELIASTDDGELLVFAAHDPAGLDAATE